MAYTLRQLALIGERERLIWKNSKVGHTGHFLRIFSSPRELTQFNHCWDTAKPFVPGAEMYGNSYVSKTLFTEFEGAAECARLTWLVENPAGIFIYLIRSGYIMSICCYVPSEETILTTIEIVMGG